jgi:hypothetical protein
VRSHAKASSAGTTQRQATGLGRIFRGVPATRGASPTSIGSGAPAAGRLSHLLCALVAALALLALLAAPASAAAPTIKATWSQDVVFKEAILKAEINPEGLATTYHFEWGTTASYGSSSSEKSAGEDSEDHVVSLFLDDLQPGTTYHYRVVASNGDGVSEGPDHTFTTYEPFVPETNCANQVFRIGPALRLPDCRAYEMVSPIDKDGGTIVAPSGGSTGKYRAGFDKASIDGDKVTYSSGTSFGDQPSNRVSNQYLSSRGPSGWSTDGISAPLGDSLAQKGLAVVTHWAFDTQFLWFAEDLSTAWIRDNNVVPLRPDVPAGFGNLYRRDNSDGTYHEPALTSEPLLWNESKDNGPFLPASDFNETTLTFKGRSEDGSHVVFEAGAQLIPGANPGLNAQIYERVNGVLRLVSVLPDGTPNSYPTSRVGAGHNVLQDSVGTERATVDRAISEDGTRIFWTSAMSAEDTLGRDGRVFVRVDGQTTIPVSESVTAEPSRFETASIDGSTAIFSFDPDGNAPKSDDLYEFDVDTETPTLIAHEVTAVAGASENLSHLYFVSGEALDAGASAGEPNLYLRRAGTIDFIATLSGEDVGGPGNFPSIGGSPSPGTRGVRVTADGSHLAFMSNRSLTGYDNTEAVSGKAAVEVFLYDADADELTCVSCNASGARPRGGGTRQAYQVNKPEQAESPWWTAAWIPPWEHEHQAARLLSDDGNRLYFNAVDSLVPWDTNGVQDVYQWEAQGTGTCQRAGGCVSLISTGSSPFYSEFVDATPDGSDVFIRTASSIDPRDPGAFDIYDVRVGGGYPPPPPPPPPCVGDSCQNVPEPPVDPTPASASFRGAGDPAPRKPRRSCKARKRHAAKGSQARHKAAKRCRRASRRAAR